MRYRTAAKTGRTAHMQLEMLRSRSFSDYAAMVERLSAVYVRPLSARLGMQERTGKWGQSSIKPRREEHSDVEIG